jgi:hypothetical protein
MFKLFESLWSPDLRPSDERNGLQQSWGPPASPPSQLARQRGIRVIRSLWLDSPSLLRLVSRWVFARRRHGIWTSIQSNNFLWTFQYPHKRKYNDVNNPDRHRFRAEGDRQDRHGFSKCRTEDRQFYIAMINPCCAPHQAIEDSTLTYLNGHVSRLNTSPCEVTTSSPWFGSENCDSAKLRPESLENKFGFWANPAQNQFKKSLLRKNLASSSWLSFNSCANNEIWTRQENVSCVRPWGWSSLLEFVHVSPWFHGLMICWNHWHHLLDYYSKLERWISFTATLEIHAYNHDSAKDSGLPDWRDLVETDLMITLCRFITQPYAIQKVFCFRFATKLCSDHFARCHFRKRMIQNNKGQ